MRPLQRRGPRGRGTKERASFWRHLMAPAGGALPQSRNLFGGRGLSERSEFRSPKLRDWGKGTRRATPGRQWFWVLLPKQKDLAVRGRNPARTHPLLSFPQVFSGNPVSLCSCSRSIPGQSPGHASCGSERTPKRERAMRWRGYEDKKGKRKILDPRSSRG